MKYHNEINKVLEDFQQGIILRKKAIKILCDIEEKYARDYEPDGDLQFAASVALDKILEKDE